jgi:transcriptional regulator with XRE-family HTH domain
MNFGKALRIVRSAKNISQKQLSKKTDLDPSYISLLEKSKRTPTIETLQKIVKALDIPLHLFFLLASDKDQIKSTSSNKKRDIAEILLNLLLSVEK